MAGVSGPCPTCQNTIAAPLPEAAPIANPEPFSQTPQEGYQPAPQQPIPAQQIPQQAPPQQAPPQQAPPQVYSSPQQAPPQAAEEQFSRGPAPGGLPPNRSAGQIPQQQGASNAADPRSLNVAAGAAASQRGRAENLSDQGSPAKPVQAKRRFWPVIVFPILFIGLSLAVIWLILDLAGFFKPDEAKDKQSIINPSESILGEAASNKIPAGSPPARLPEPPSSTSPPTAIPLPDEEIKHDERDLSDPSEVPSSLPDLTADKKKKQPKKVLISLVKTA